MKQSKGLNGELKLEHKLNIKMTTMSPITYIEPQSKATSSLFFSKVVTVLDRIHEPQYKTIQTPQRIEKGNTKYIQQQNYRLKTVNSKTIGGGGWIVFTGIKSSP